MATARSNSVARRPENPLKDLLAEVMEEAAREQAANNNPDQERILRSLEELGSLSVQEDSLIFQGDKFILPAQFAGNVDKAIRFLEEWREQQEQEWSYNRTFKYRPLDGAHAFQVALKRIFGTTGVGKTRFTFFGKILPEMRTIDIGVNKTAQVPWGEVNYSPLDAVFRLRATRDPEYGMVFHLSVEAPKKFARHIQAVFDMIEDVLANESIYRGKAINGAPDPQFVDTSRVKPEQVVYDADTLTQLDANLWAGIRYAPQLRASGQPISRKVLIEGPYGTGKSLAGVLTAQHSERAGFTFIMCRAGDDLAQALNTAKLYAPAVVWFEDIDVVASDGTAQEISKLLDTLDSINTKGLEIVAAFTTNHVSKIQKGVMRPGRIDAVVHIGELDADGMRRLVQSAIQADMLDDEIDWDLVTEAYKGFLPAFVKEAASRSVRYTIARNGGQTRGKILTEDLVRAGDSLRPQLDLMQGAKEGANVPTVDGVLGDKVLAMVAEALGRSRFVDSDGDMTSLAGAVGLKVATEAELAEE
jgi:hypothetical protein